MDVRPNFWLINSTEKMMTFLKHNQKRFKVLHPVHKYTKMEIAY